MAERAALLTSLFLKGRLRSDLTDAEQAALEKCVSRTISIDPRSALVSRGQWTECSYLIVEGTMLRHIDGRKGERQLVTVNISRDFIDLHGYAMKRLDHDISSLTQCVLAQVPHEKITTLIENFPIWGARSGSPRCLMPQCTGNGFSRSDVSMPKGGLLI